VGQFEKWLQDNLIIVAGIFVGVALLQVRSPCLIVFFIEKREPTAFKIKYVPKTKMFGCDFVL